MSRFDYVRYDAETTERSLDFKGHCMALESKLGLIRENAAGDYMKTVADLGPYERLSSYHTLAIVKLEEFYMYVGKMLREAQILKNGSAELQEERGNE